MNESISPIVTEVNPALRLTSWQYVLSMLSKVLLSALGLVIGAFMALLVALFSGWINFTC